MLEALRLEIQDDPAGLGYNTADLADIELKINAKNVTRVYSRIITSRGAAALFPKLAFPARSMAFEAAMLKLETFANTQKDSADVSTKLIARAVYRQLDSFNRTGLDMGDLEVHGMLDLLASMGVITPPEAEGFKAMGIQVCSRAEQIGYSYVTDTMIREALE